MKFYLVAPSFGCTTSPYVERLDKAISNLTELGIDIVYGPNIRLNVGVVGSNTPKLRAREINDAFKSDADVILSVGGGETMVEILPYIDFESIKNNPKVFCGFSDNTNLTYLITILCNQKTIYGANAPSFYDISYGTLDTYKALTGTKSFTGYHKWEANPIKTDPLSPLNLTENKILKLYNYHSFSGIMLGGCLDCLIGLCGTKFDKTRDYIKNKDIIWYLEACDLNVLGQRRAYNQLKQAGWFDTVKGFIIGRPLNSESFMGLDIYSNVIDILGEFNVPIVMDADLGHLSPSLPFINGVFASVLVKDNNIFIEYKE